MSVSVLQPEAASTQSPAMSPEWLWRCSVEQYHQMIQVGILTENDRVELLDGWLVRQMTEKPPHTAATDAVLEELKRVIPSGWYVRGPHPITLSNSEPEPDAAVARGDRHRYRQRHPGPADLALVVEVSDATLTTDRTTKKHLYAEAGIPVYWLINLAGSRVEVYADPSRDSLPPNYRQHRDFRLDEAVPVEIDGLEVGRISVRELLD